MENKTFIWLGIAMCVITNSASIYSMYGVKRDTKTGRLRKTPLTKRTPQPTPTAQPPTRQPLAITPPPTAGMPAPTRQPLAIMPPPSTEEITPQPAPVNIRLSLQKQALKDVMRDFNNKFSTLILPSNKQSLDNIIAGRISEPAEGLVQTPPPRTSRGTTLLPEETPLSLEEIEAIRALQREQQQERKRGFIGDGSNL
jgi:hypothetical protein